VNRFILKRYDGSLPYPPQELTVTLTQRLVTLVNALAAWRSMQNNHSVAAADSLLYFRWFYHLNLW
jgi:hypothetical protein